MSQLTLQGRPLGAYPYSATSLAVPMVVHPDTPTSALGGQAHTPWGTSGEGAYMNANADANMNLNVTYVPTNYDGGAPVVLPGSVEEPPSPEEARAGGEEAGLLDVSMKGPSWYEVEKDRKSFHHTPSVHPRYASTSSHTLGRREDPRSTSPSLYHSPYSCNTPSPFAGMPSCSLVADALPDAGIVITDLEGSDSEDEGDSQTNAGAGPGAPAYKISAALLDRLPHPLTRGHDPSTSPSAGALVLYRPLVITPDGVPEGREDSEVALELEGAGRGLGGEDGISGEPMGGSEGTATPMEDTRPCTPMTLESELSVDEDAGYEPMDIEML